MDAKDKKESKFCWKEVWPLALGIALLPPLWAVVAPYVGVSVGAVALICAGVYVANGNKVQDGIKISIGFLLGDLWAFLVVFITDKLQFNPDVETFCCLFILGALAVIIASLIPKYIFLPAWLCGWAVGITIMAPVGLSAVGSLPIQIGVAMLMGVWYVGAGVDKFAGIVSKVGKK